MVRRIDTFGPIHVCGGFRTDQRRLFLTLRTLHSSGRDTANTVGMLIGKAGNQHVVLLREHDPNIVEVVFAGEIGMREMEYLARLSEIVRSSRRRRSLLYDTLGVTGFTHQIVGAHAGFANSHQESLERIAVVSQLTSVRFAVTTAALWQPIPIKMFVNRNAALSWLRA